MDIGLSVYKSILALIKGRLTVKLEFEIGNIDENILKKKSNDWLNFSLFLFPHFFGILCVTPNFYRLF